MRAVIASATTAAIAVIGVTAWGAFQVPETQAPVNQTATLSPDVQLLEPVRKTPLMAANAAPAPAAAALDTPAAAPVIMASAAETPEATRKPVLCFVWGIQKFAEKTGIIQASAEGAAVESFPVPTPVWVMSQLFTMGEAQDV